MATRIQALRMRAAVHQFSQMSAYIQLPQLILRSGLVFESLAGTEKI
jgi:hypothetical protein